MKTKLLLLLSVLLTITKGFAQTPQAIPYQAVARDAAGTALTNRTLSVRFKIHDTTATGIVVYSESQTIVTNSVGTFTANIGQGTVLSGSFANINWVAPKFIQVEMDLAGGTAFVDMGTKQMLSVPYALNSADWIEVDYPVNNFYFHNKTIKPNKKYTNFATGFADADGLFSTAMGFNSSASSNYSTAMGYRDSASGIASTAIGKGSRSFGEASTAIGQSTASGKFSTAIGQSTASGISSTALGLSTASGISSTAMGYVTTASGDYSTAMGNQSTASGIISTAMGFLSKASGDYSTAMGNKSTASGYISTALGESTTASGYNSTAMGYLSTASGNFSTAMGDNTIASGNFSTAMGLSSTAKGENSTAMGFNTAAWGNSSTAMGCNTAALGDYSTAMGRNVGTNARGSFVIADSDPYNVGDVTHPINDQFVARFYNGYFLMTSDNNYIGVNMGHNDNGWSQISDSTRKENMLPINEEEFLKKISSFRPCTWNYKGQDANIYRHYGPMAQDFFKAFGHDAIGTIGCDTLINQSDFLGVSFSAIHALEKRTQKLDHMQMNLEALIKENAEIKKENQDIKKELEEIKQLLKAK